MKKIILSFLLVFSVTVAQAGEVNPKFFKDWISLCDLLRTKGIDPSWPSWPVIIPMCLPLKSSDDEVPYNRCLYEKTMDSYQWQVDAKYCAEKSEQKYPDSLLDVQNVRSYVETDSKGNRKSVQENIRPYNSRSDLLKDRNISYKDCMFGLDWNDTEQWTMGRRSQ